MVLNGLSAALTQNNSLAGQPAGQGLNISGYKSLADITVEFPLRIDPAGWAFGIWGLIYSLLACFVVYQALPSEWVPDRNNAMIFDHIGYWFFINMLLNAVWISIFQVGQTWGFILALIDIAAMVFTAVIFTNEANSYSVTSFEFMTMRTGFGIYAGWITGATILNSAIMLKSMGVDEAWL